ncbi:hypothetical protein WJ542_29795 [Paraburkholderia sp. B3]|uniref:hypothetical protein n=1 Tax=Paraburkholderia sp. B3 TaxID=3134791 RepID=UPI003981F8CF
MSESKSSTFIPDDRFFAAQVAFYIFATFQIIAAIILVANFSSIPLASQATTLQRLFVTLNGVVTDLAFSVAYFLLGVNLSTYTKFVWRMAMAMFLTNLSMNVLTLIIRPSFFPSLSICIGIAGLVSLWRGRDVLKGQS